MPRSTCVAISCWNERVAPLFDVARNVLLLRVEERSVVDRNRATVDASDPLRRARSLAGLGADALVCGAVSETLRRLLESHEIRVIPFVSGSVDEVVEAYLAGDLPSPTLAMPGTAARSRRRWEPSRPGPDRGRRP